MNPDHEIQKIGRGLVDFSKKSGLSSRYVLDDLRPYILEACKRMSSRAISRYFKEQHNLNVSYSTIYRVICEQKKGEK